MSNPWAIDTAEFLAFMQEIGSAHLLTVNYGYHQYNTTETDGSVENAAALAAD
jgi:hypothetical protein